MSEQPSASQGERHQEKPTLPTLWPWPSGLQNGPEHCSEALSLKHRQPILLPKSHFPGPLIRRHKGPAPEEHAGNKGEAYSLFGQARVKGVGFGGCFRQGGAGLLDLAQLLICDDVKHGIVRRPAVGVYTGATEADGERRDRHSEAQDREGALWGMGYQDTPPRPTRPTAILSGCERNGCQDIPESSGTTGETAHNLQDLS